MDNKIFRKLTYGLYIVSTSINDNNVGCVVNTVTQITSENPILAVSINKNNYTNKILKESKKIAINVLSQSINPDIIKVFGFQTSKEVNKFQNIDVEYIENMPVLSQGICGYIIGDIINIIDAETHDIFLIRVTNTNCKEDEVVLTYDYYRLNMKGISPKNAPTYIENKIEESNSKVYRCKICGHLYKDSEEAIKFEDLPDDWVCPVCGVGKDKFELIN